MIRAVSVAFALTAVGLAGWSAFLAFPSAADTTPPGPAETGKRALIAAQNDEIAIENAEEDKGNRPLGDHRVVFRITNRSANPSEILGASLACNPMCCFEVTDAGRVAMAPGETTEIAGMLNVRRPGPFTFEGELYVNYGGQLRALRYKIIGVGEPHVQAP